MILHISQTFIILSIVCGMNTLFSYVHRGLTIFVRIYWYLFCLCITLGAVLAVWG